jgi:TonB family protein
MRRVGVSIAIGGAATVVALLAPGAALSADEPDVAPNWLSKPSLEDLVSVWPAASLQSGKGGRVQMSCTVNLLGRLMDCSVVEETPAGAGFGAAALAMAPQFLMKPAMKDGKPVLSQVRIPIRFPDMGAPVGSSIPGAGMQALPTVRVLSVGRWERAPSVADVVSAYPPKAAAEKLGGLAALDCAFTRTGELTDCAIAREEPPGRGFGSAARVLARKFTGPTVDGAGKSVTGARTQLPFTFAPSLLEGASPLLSRPKWTATPTAADLAGLLPDAAAKAGKLTARVVLGCVVGEGGSLDACQVESEDPAGLGYGEATLRLAKAFKVTTWSADGMPAIGAKVRAPMRYDFSEQVSAAAKD